ncbi:DUF1127 domain-containing protein [Primorskyibacter sp. S187A]|uniref:DUF1127 domain-containing protein n=1 Tax=Primorskyibacter sp. S187A TaxID=3415130 RepID=UPI003C7B90EE
MAHFVDELNQHPTLLARVADLFESLVTSSSRVRELERLNAMTDDQLNALGLRRQDIVQRVFGDHLAS